MITINSLNRNRQVFGHCNVVTNRLVVAEFSRADMIVQIIVIEVHGHSFVSPPLEVLKTLCICPYNCLDLSLSHVQRSSTHS